VAISRKCEYIPRPFNTFIAVAKKYSVCQAGLNSKMQDRIFKRRPLLKLYNSEIKELRNGIESRCVEHNFFRNKNL
jgi:hypothetical protein